MPKVTDKELEMVPIRLFKDDLDYLRRVYRDTIGVNAAVRSIVHSFVTQTKAEADKTIDQLETTG